MNTQFVLFSILARTVVGSDQGAAFNRWFHNLDPTNRKVEVKNTESWGRGVFTTTAVRDREKVMKIPGRWVLSADSIMKKGENIEMYRKLSDSDKLIAWLLIEKQKGIESEWAAWLEVLPETFQNGIHFTPRDLELVEPVATRHDILRLQRTTSTEYAIFKKTFPVSDTEYKWAKSVLSTRAWHMRGKEYLVPVAGMFNHRPDSEDSAYNFRTATGKRSQKFLKYHEISPDGSALVYSDREAVGNVELHESYGDNTNYIYLAYHGFVPEQNPYECYQYTFDALPSVKTSFLRSVSAPNQVCLHNGEAAPSFLLYHAVRSLPEKRLACLSTVNPSSKASALWSCGKHKSKSLKSAIKHLTRILSTTYTTSLEEDLALLASDRLAGAALAAVEYRSTQKEILHSIINELEAMLRRVKRKKNTVTTPIDEEL
eukprot:TRINITY_DN4087_c2_g2_i1.p1 TRINITY_DN4087_c2_g2~~TRINITY_DN4087_c2_g2_i1.p1  ORF type:complete len:450 (+),score=72.40 TRINITY_DN4087_c2_g2_i1:65-1351(+)